MYPFINLEKLYLLPLYIKIGLIKNSVQIMDQESAGFMYFKYKLPRVSDAKIKVGVLVGPQIRQLIQDV
jgi:hypothetical protein